MYSTLYSRIIPMILAVTFLTACGGKDKKDEKAPGPGGAKAGGPPVSRVDAFVVRTSPLSDNLELPGSLIANESTPVNPEISGRLVYLNATEGKAVGRNPAGKNL